MLSCMARSPSKAAAPTNSTTTNSCANSIWGYERKDRAVKSLSRRSVLGGSLGLATAATLAGPHVARAAAKTATVWWVQGFAQEEDIAFKKLVADYEKASGNVIEANIIPYAPMRQKIISAITSGEVPDLFQNTPFETIALFAWDDKLVDVSDVVDPQREAYTDAAMATVRCYNNVEKRRGIY